MRFINYFLCIILVQILLLFQNCGGHHYLTGSIIKNSVTTDTTNNSNNNLNQQQDPPINQFKYTYLENFDDENFQDTFPWHDWDTPKTSKTTEAMYHFDTIAGSGYESNNYHNPEFKFSNHNFSNVLFLTSPDGGSWIDDGIFFWVDTPISGEITFMMKVVDPTTDGSPCQAGYNDSQQYLYPLPQTISGQTFDWQKFTIPFKDTHFIHIGVTHCDAYIDDLELKIY